MTDVNTKTKPKNLLDSNFNVSITVNAIIETLLFELNNQIKNGLYGSTQRSMAYNSNKIEGSTLTEKQTQYLFDTGSITVDEESIYIKTKDVEEMTGHFLMFNNMLRTYDQPLTHDLIKSYHYDLRSGVFEDRANGYAIGDYKTLSNRVARIQTVEPEEVFFEMEQLLNEYNAIDTITIEDIVRFHSRYEQIHPFQDGNGRTGRLIMYKECLRNRIIPFIIHNDNRLEYYAVLEKSQLENNISDFVNYVAKEQNNYMEEVNFFIGKMISEKTFQSEVQEATAKQEAERTAVDSKRTSKGKETPEK